MISPDYSSTDVLPTAETNKAVEKKSAQDHLNQIRASLKNATDGLGMPIDKGIKETVVYLNALDLPTLQSCEGHIDWGSPYPWVIVGAPNEPDERFIGQTKVFQKVADKYQVPLEEIVRMRHEGYREAISEASKQPETVEFIAWRDQNTILMQHANDYLNLFYQQHPQPAVPLATMPMVGNEFFLQPNISLREVFLWEEMSQQQKDELGQNLKTHQAEMRAFTDFLKQQYETQP